MQGYTYNICGLRVQYMAILQYLWQAYANYRRIQTSHPIREPPPLNTFQTCNLNRACASSLCEAQSPTGHTCAAPAHVQAQLT